MKKLLLLCLVATCCICTQSFAQENRADDLKKQAQESLEKKEYIKARYLFLQAYNAYSAAKDYEDAVTCGVNASALYHRENYYKEAFELLAGAEQLVTAGETNTGQKMPVLRYPIAKERMRMYLNMGRLTNAKTQLGLLESNAQAAGNDSLATDLLYTRAAYYYVTRQNKQGDEAVKQLLAESSRMQAEQAQAKYDALKKQYDESLQTIADKDSSLSTKQYLIIGLCVLAAILAASLIGVALILLRFVILTRKQKKVIRTANENNEQKTLFIRNISAQMEPTLNTLDASQPGVTALRTFADHIQTGSDWENSLSEPYEMQEKNISTFCEEVMDTIRSKVQDNVSLTVNAPKLSIKIAPEPLEQVLTHLLENAAYYTPAEGKIWLDFKKRGAHTHQFIITDTGCGVPEEKRELIFKPFSEIKDLTQGDGLGLPICSLLATKMNGNLTLDTAYTKGARFVLELHV